MNNVDIFNICLAKKLSGGGGGTYESKSVTPDFSNGDVTVSPDEGYDALTSVIIEKDADLIADNIRKDTEIFGITGTLDSGSDTATLDALIDGSSTSISNSRVTAIRSYAFYYDTGLTSASFPNVESVGSYAFYNCSNLTTVDIPNSTVLGAYVFQSCTSLTTVSFPDVTSLGQSVFNGCKSLTSVNFPSVTSVGSSCFSGCSNLPSINLPSVTSIPNGVFYGCNKLVIADFLSLSSIASGAFNVCANLNTVILRKSDSICTLENVNGFTSTPFNSGNAGGTIYVPQALIASYQADTNWPTVLGWNANNKILAIEGSPYENP